jgi:hypothetical protein
MGRRYSITNERDTKFWYKICKEETSWGPRCGQEENMNMDLPEVSYVEIN